MNQHQLPPNQPDGPDRNDPDRSGPDVKDPILDDPDHNESDRNSLDLDDADPDDPPDRPELAHLRPDRICIGTIGVFAGDWAWTPDAEGAMRIPVAFVGTLVDRWNGWAVFVCTRQVAQAIVEDQQAHRDQLRRDLTELGVPEEDLDRRVNAELADLHFDGDVIVADQRVMSDDPEAIDRIEPDPDGRYVVMGRNWCWEAVHKEAIQIRCGNTRDLGSLTAMAF